MSRYSDDTPSVQLKLSWDPNAIKGYIGAALIVTTMFLVSMCAKVEPPKPFRLPDDRDSGIVLISLGSGDGTGRRHGNATAEGAAQKGKQVADPLRDASRAAASSSSTKPATDPSQSARLNPVRDIGARGKNPADADPSEMTIGKDDGRDDGSGTGWAGTGKGKGDGMGDIDWGGGGNRTVVKKELPKFPPGTWNTEVRLRFRVLSDGTVSSVIPVRRGGNPAVDAAAIQAMYKWRFNKLSKDIQMEGVITFVFKNG